MATTIQSTALDFNRIKNNLKTYFKQQEEFKDYNFEAAGLSNILDVLAYNTHINGLIANFALNESFLPTAQLRSSMVSLAEGIGYIPDTETSSQAKVRILFNSSVTGRPTKVTLPAYTKFTASVDDVSYEFLNIEPFTAIDDGSGFYEFKTNDGLNRIPIFEGTLRNKTFLVGEVQDNPVYVIPDKTLDADTVTVKVFDSTTSTRFSTYTNILNARSINSNSTIYILKESPNGFFELSFGDGTTFGIAPKAGQRIEVEYLTTKGSVANGATLFTPVSQFTDGNITTDLTVTTLSNSVGGKAKESIESIRLNAPFQYATQNRMVTAEDYASLINRNFSALIQDIASWGGQDNSEPEFGAVYVSILFEDTVDTDTIAATKGSILTLANQLSIVSFNLRFVEPVTTFVEVDTTFQFNPKLTDLTINAITQSVIDITTNYFDENTGKFGQSFRRSNLLTLVDESSPAILSSRANVRMQQRITPTAPSIVNLIKSLLINPSAATTEQLNKITKLVTAKAFNEAATFMANQEITANNFTFNVNKLAAAANNINQVLQFPTAIDNPDNETFTVTTTQFTFDSKLCLIRNKLNSTTLQIVTAAGGTIVVDNIGSYDAIAGTVTLNYFTPSALSAGASQIKVSVVPANQSVIFPNRNNRILLDLSNSLTTPIETEASN
tara:strand:+ start:754 stop:2760 length:2007 start_codon:yes stop_codon:yes gene_type:complete